MAACRQLGFDVTGNSAIWSADLENPTLEPNMKCTASPFAEIWPVAYLGGIWNPLLGRRGGRRGSEMAPFKRAMVVSYRFSNVTVALSLHGLAPPYLSEDCLTDVGRWHLMSSDVYTCVVPRTLSQIGERSFSVAGPRLWNNLPTEIRTRGTTFGHYDFLSAPGISTLTHSLTLTHQ